VFEEGDYDAPQVDGWGVSDVVLLDKAHKTLLGEKMPFFAFIQTAGNHRPYGIPDEHPGFELAQADAAKLEANGFDGLAAFNGLRYLDFALGSYFAKAKESPYFKNTVFVMYGDHGNPSTQQTPWQELLLTGYHVPCVIYAPGLVKPGRIDFTASLPDILPTSLGLLGVPYLNTALGRDLLDLGPGDRHFSLIGTNGVLDDEFYLRSDPGNPRLFPYRSDTGAASDVHERYPEKVAELQRLQEALYETAKYLLYHNPPRAHAAAVPKEDRK
jgi:phosphoglycerol transferase MdoB-like AlkP superfamily enzyme